MMDANRVGQVLAQKGVVKPCRRCNHMNFSVLNGFTKFILQQDFRDGVEVAGASVAVVNVACANCGGITDMPSASLVSN